MGYEDGWYQVGKGGKPVNDDKEKGKAKGKSKGKGNGKRAYAKFEGQRTGTKPYENDKKWEWNEPRKPKKYSPYTFCTGCGSYTWDKKKGPTCGFCGLGWPVWDEESKEEPKSEAVEWKAGEWPGLEESKEAPAVPQAAEKYGKYGNPGGKAEARDEARKQLGEANAIFAKIQGAVQRLHKELNDGEVSIARMVAEVHAKRAKMVEKHTEVLEETAKMEEARNRKRSIEDKEYEAVKELNEGLARNLEPARFSNLGKADASNMEIEKDFFGLSGDGRAQGCTGRRPECSGHVDGAQRTPKAVTSAQEKAKGEEAEAKAAAAPVADVASTPPQDGAVEKVKKAKPAEVLPEATEEIPEECYDIRRRAPDDMGCSESEGSQDATDHEFEYDQDEDESQAGDLEISSKEEWTEAMVNFIWQAKNTEELPEQCPELAKWLNTWNDSENETCKDTCREMLEIARWGIETLAEKRKEYYWEMQQVEATAATGHLEVAEQKFYQVEAYADALKVHFGSWMRTEIGTKLDKLADARDAAVADGSATHRSVKIARAKLKARVPRIKGGAGKGGRKSGTTTSGQVSKRIKKVEKANKKPEAGKEALQTSDAAASTK